MILRNVRLQGGTTSNERDGTEVADHSLLAQGTVGLHRYPAKVAPPAVVLEIEIEALSVGFPGNKRDACKNRTRLIQLVDQDELGKEGRERDGTKDLARRVFERDLELIAGKKAIVKGDHVHLDRDFLATIDAGSKRDLPGNDLLHFRLVAIVDTRDRHFETADESALAQDGMIHRIHRDPRPVLMERGEAVPFFLADQGRAGHVAFRRIECRGEDSIRLGS